MTMIPPVFTADDLPDAIRFADTRPSARWYVTKRAVALGLVASIPAAWGTVTAAAEPSQAERDQLAAKGHALPDGSYPIRNKADIQNAIHAMGRAGGDLPKARKERAVQRVKRHIIKRARALDALDALPAEWGITAAGVTAAGLFRRGERDAGAAWNEALHPRGRDGKWIERGGAVNVFDSSSADKPSLRGTAVGVKSAPGGKTILSVKLDHPGFGPDGRQHAAGEVIDVPSDNISSAPPAKAHLNQPDPNVLHDIASQDPMQPGHAPEGAPTSLSTPVADESKWADNRIPPTPEEEAAADAAFDKAGFGAPPSTPVAGKFQDAQGQNYRMNAVDHPKGQFERADGSRYNLTRADEPATPEAHAPATNPSEVVPGTRRLDMQAELEDSETALAQAGMDPNAFGFDAIHRAMIGGRTEELRQAYADSAKSVGDVIDHADPENTDSDVMDALEGTESMLNDHLESISGDPHEGATSADPDVEGALAPDTSFDPGVTANPPVDDLLQRNLDNAKTRKAAAGYVNITPDQLPDTVALPGWDGKEFRKNAAGNYDIYDSATGRKMSAGASNADIHNNTPEMIAAHLNNHNTTQIRHGKATVGPDGRLPGATPSASHDEFSSPEYLDWENKVTDQLKTYGLSDQELSDVTDPNGESGNWQEDYASFKDNPKGYADAIMSEYGNATDGEDPGPPGAPTGDTRAQQMEISAIQSTLTQPEYKPLREALAKRDWPAVESAMTNLQADGDDSPALQDASRRISEIRPPVDDSAARFDAADKAVKDSLAAGNHLSDDPNVAAQHTALEEARNRAFEQTPAGQKMIADQAAASGVDTNSPAHEAHAAETADRASQTPEHMTTTPDQKIASMSDTALRMVANGQSQHAPAAQVELDRRNASGPSSQQHGDNRYTVSKEPGDDGLTSFKLENGPGIPGLIGPKDQAGPSHRIPSPEELAQKQALRDRVRPMASPGNLHTDSKGNGIKPGDRITVHRANGNDTPATVIKTEDDPNAIDMPGRKSGVVTYRNDSGGQGSTSSGKVTTHGADTTTPHPAMQALADHIAANPAPESTRDLMDRAHVAYQAQQADKAAELTAAYPGHTVTAGPLGGLNITGPDGKDKGTILRNSRTGNYDVQRGIGNSSMDHASPEAAMAHVAGESVAKQSLRDQAKPRYQVLPHSSGTGHNVVDTHDKNPYDPKGEAPRVVRTFKGKPNAQKHANDLNRGVDPHQALRDQGQANQANHVHREEQKELARRKAKGLDEHGNATRPISTSIVSNQLRVAGHSAQKPSPARRTHDGQLIQDSSLPAGFKVTGNSDGSVLIRYNHPEQSGSYYTENDKARVAEREQQIMDHFNSLGYDTSKDDQGRITVSNRTGGSLTPSQQAASDEIKNRAAGMSAEDAATRRQEQSGAGRAAREAEAELQQAGTPRRAMEAQSDGPKLSGEAVSLQNGPTRDQMTRMVANLSDKELLREAAKSSNPVAREMARAELNRRQAAKAPTASHAAENAVGNNLLNDLGVAAQIGGPAQLNGEAVTISRVYRAPSGETRAVVRMPDGKSQDIAANSLSESPGKA